MVWVRIANKSSPSFYVSCVYNPNAGDENYYQCMLNNFENVLAKNKEIVILGDLNIKGSKSSHSGMRKRFVNNRLLLLFYFVLLTIYF